MKYLKKFNENWIDLCDQHFDIFCDFLKSEGFEISDNSGLGWGFFKEDFIKIYNSSFDNKEKAAKIASLCEDEFDDSGELFDLAENKMLDILNK